MLCISAIPLFLSVSISLRLLFWLLLCLFGLLLTLWLRLLWLMLGLLLLWFGLVLTLRIRLLGLLLGLLRLWLGLLLSVGRSLFGVFWFALFVLFRLTLLRSRLSVGAILCLLLFLSLV